MQVLQGCPVCLLRHDEVYQMRQHSWARIAKTPGKRTFRAYMLMLSLRPCTLEEACTIAADLQLGFGENWQSLDMLMKLAECAHENFGQLAR